MRPPHEKDKVAPTLGTKGSIAVQVHGGNGARQPGRTCRRQNIRIKRLG